ncbi:MAG: pyruvate, water dikinase regulatory protein [Bacillota bacterium]
MDKHQPVVYVISDSLGETAELVARAATSQFNSGHVEMRRIPYVTDKDYLEEIIAEAATHDRVIIAYTIVVQEVKEHLIKLANEKNLIAVDLLGPLIRSLADVLGLQPRMEPGLLRKLDEQYFRKVEAIEFAVKYDDGKDSRGLLHADVVMIGVSRTSKTPVCMYLAHKRIKAANIPLVPEVSPPEELFQTARRRIVGLTISPNLLFEIRQARLKSLGLAAGADYANMDRIMKELEYSEGIMKRIACPIIDVTNRAVEETASRILEIYFKGERHERH